MCVIWPPICSEVRVYDMAPSRGVINRFGMRNGKMNMSEIYRWGFPACFHMVGGKGSKRTNLRSRARIGHTTASGRFDVSTFYMQYQSDHLRKRPRGLNILEIDSLGLSNFINSFYRWTKSTVLCRTSADHLMYRPVRATQLHSTHERTGSSWGCLNSSRLHCTG